MPVTIYAQDKEFAVASGDNINVTSDYSYFDYPPNSTTDLTVTSNAGDDNQFLFETGETYDLSWAGNSGGGVMEDAVVIRSDYLGPGQGAIVFEGINSITGEPFQLVWSPGFDLEAWYWENNGGPSSPNAFYTSDQNTTDSVQVACYAAGTEIQTIRGEVRVENLRTGDLVKTADNGFCPIFWIFSGTTPLENCDDSLRPILIKAGALGPNRPQRDLILSAQHRLLVGADMQLSQHFPTPALAPALLLTTLPGVRVMRGRKRQTWFHFALQRHEVVFANGCASESLSLGAMVLNGLTFRTRCDLISSFRKQPDGRSALNGPPARPILNRRDVQSALSGNTLPRSSQKMQPSRSLVFL